jgi:hypothetical protein
MAVANREPVFVSAPDVQYPAGAIIGPSANTALDGTGANTYVAYQAPATYGGYVAYLRAKAVGSPAATVMRVFLHTTTSTFTAGTTNTASNTVMLTEITLPSITQSQTAASPDFTVPVNYWVSPAMRILVTFGTSTGSAGTGYVVVPVCFSYAPTY